MKRFFIIISVFLFSMACTPEDDGMDVSLDVSPLSLVFSADDANPQEISVNASEGLEWGYSVSPTADWITIEEEADKLIVSVAENITEEQRVATVVVAADNENIPEKNVIVTQKGADTPEVYSLTVEPALLSFASEHAEAQVATVTAVGKGITWSVAVEESGQKWITVSAMEGIEGETALTVTVADNPDTKERKADIVITADKESVSPQTVRVVQEAKVLPPSMSVTLDNGAEPDKGYAYDYKGTDGTQGKITVQAVNVEWSATVSYDSETTDWITINQYKGEEVNMITFTVAKNLSPESRTGKIIVTTETEGIGPLEIPVTQDGMPEFLSTLIEDVELGTFVNNKVIVSPNNDYRDYPYTYWDMRFWTEDISLNKFDRYVGSGEKLCIYLASTPLQADSDEMYLPDGVYDVGAYFEYGVEPEPWVISGGADYSDPTYPNGCWYQILLDDEYTDRVCLTGGTMTVSRSGDVYTLTFDFISDAGYKVTGSFEGTFDLYVQ